MESGQPLAEQNFNLLQKKCQCHFTRVSLDHVYVIVHTFIIPSATSPDQIFLPDVISRIYYRSTHNLGIGIFKATVLVLIAQI